MEKKGYESPKIKRIGDMANNTLGASGTGADSGTFRGGYGSSNSGGSSSTNTRRGSAFDRSAFDKSVFDRK